MKIAILKWLLKVRTEFTKTYLRVFFTHIVGNWYRPNPSLIILTDLILIGIALIIIGIALKFKQIFKS